MIGVLVPLAMVDVAAMRLAICVNPTLLLLLRALICAAICLLLLLPSLLKVVVVVDAVVRRRFLLCRGCCGQLWAYVTAEQFVRDRVVDCFEVPHDAAFALELPDGLHHAPAWPV